MRVFLIVIVSSFVCAGITTLITLMCSRKPSQDYDTVDECDGGEK